MRAAVDREGFVGVVGEGVELVDLCEDGPDDGRLGAGVTVAVPQLPEVPGA